jgi:hypothetical protein
MRFQSFHPIVKEQPTGSVKWILVSIRLEELSNVLDPERQRLPASHGDYCG